MNPNMAASNGFRARQPGKALWSLVAIIHITFYTLFLSVYYLPKSTRQNPHWTYRNAVSNDLLKVALYHIGCLKFLLRISMSPGAEKERFVEMEPQNATYTGDLKSQVKPVAVGGTWYPEAFQNGDEQKSVVLHFHGGSFIFGSGRISECAAPAALLTKHLADKALFVQYRLAGDAGCHFPAAIQDAITSYQYLLKQGVPASKIIVSGDSAGGSIAVALLRYLSEQTKSGMESQLPNPAGCALWSPSIDLATQTQKGIDLHRNYKTDYLGGTTLAWGIGLYNHASMDLTGRWFSPLRHPFATEVPIWVMTGSAEVLTDTIVDFAERMSKISGNKVGLHEIPEAPHDVFLVGHIMGWKEEAEEAASAAAKFFKDQSEEMNQ